MEKASLKVVPLVQEARSLARGRPASLRRNVYKKLPASAFAVIRHAL
jgi:hypothetical protein